MAYFHLDFLSELLFLQISKLVLYVSYYKHGLLHYDPILLQNAAIVHTDQTYFNRDA